MESKEVFRRKETKYLLSKDKYEKLMKELDKYILKDKYYKSTICNIYFDTLNNDLIINSINKPIYKEKVRVRSYSVPTKEDNVFFEIKKKYKGIVGKRRIELKLNDLYNYFKTGELNDGDVQVRNEIDYCFKKYQLMPKLFIGYDRLSYYDKDNVNFRITFDTNLRSREDNLLLELGDDGEEFFKDGKVIMETKALGSYPIWFTNILSSLEIYPESFSKYGSIYSSKIKEENYV